MLRFVIIGLAVVLVWMTIMMVVDAARKRQIDWTGIAFMIGFVTLAFYLRSITGMG